MKGIILAGGSGTRLSPLTKVASKQLLPVFDKPLIYYPLSTLMLAGIRNILIITAPEQKSLFEKILGDGKSYGIEIEYESQDSPRGIAESLIIGEKFLSGDPVALILGDNIFHGPSLGRKLSQFAEVEGAQILGYKVKDASGYGVAILNEDGKIEKLIEKPKDGISRVAIPGIYFLDQNASKFAQRVQPGPRGELEILDLLEIYLEESRLQLEMLPRGTAWFDSGTFTDMHDASTYVRLMEERTGERVGDPLEVANNQGWI